MACHGRHENAEMLPDDRSYGRAEKLVVFGASPLRVIDCDMKQVNRFKLRLRIVVTFRKSGMKLH